MYACDPSLLLSQQPDIPTLPLANNLRQKGISDIKRFTPLNNMNIEASPNKPTGFLDDKPPTGLLTKLHVQDTSEVRGR
jgi:hypothetical protein